jgi:hypothetical protein
MPGFKWLEAINETKRQMAEPEPTPPRVSLAEAATRISRLIGRDVPECRIHAALVAGATSGTKTRNGWTIDRTSLPKAAEVLRGQN